VRGFLGAIDGPFSNEAEVSPGLQPCVQGTAAVVTAAADNSNAVVNWTAVPGVSGYIVQWSRFTGATELEETVTTNSVTRAMPFNGDFFVRVVAVSACGNTISNEAAFTIAVTRRHLSRGEILGHLRATQAAFPRAFNNAHREGNPEKWDFMILACRRLYQASGGTVGCNWRRASIGDLSMDGLSVENPSDGRYYFADVIGGAGGCCPELQYIPPFHRGALLEDTSGRYAPHGFVNPFGEPGRYLPLRTSFRGYGAAGGW
jgi:hypothetical protein